jgi:hypothetical protein
MVDNKEAANSAARTRAWKKFKREIFKAWADAGYPDEFDYKGYRHTSLAAVAEHLRAETADAVRPA